MTALSSENLEELFEQQMKEEDTSRQILLQAEQKETKAVTESSAEDIIRRALAKKKVTGMKDKWGVEQDIT